MALSMIPSEEYSISIPENDESRNNIPKRDPDYEAMIETLPKEKGWVETTLLKYRDIWFNPLILPGILLLEDHFVSLPDDIILASFPKCGTTWLKALAFAIINRNHFQFSNHPLLKKNPHECIPFLDMCFLNRYNTNLGIPSPRVFQTHIPYQILPDSIKHSSSPIVYIVREPKDVFVSSWHHMQKSRPQELPHLSLGEAFSMFCEGVYQNGPYWDHVLGYWNASLNSPEKILILTYEDMKKDALACVKKLAKHIGRPFSEDEEKGGITEEIIKLCSFENLSNLEVNKNGAQHIAENLLIENNVFFRKGGIGDWQKLMNPEMVEHMNRITTQKFDGTDLISIYP